MTTEPSGELHGAADVLGLCGTCRYAEILRSARGSDFLRCALSDHDPDFARFPTLPVLQCRGYADLGSERH